MYQYLKKKKNQNSPNHHRNSIVVIIITVLRVPTVYRHNLVLTTNP